jgi:tRNA G18 (ribose-2'-O)-methylase SpoU
MRRGRLPRPRPFVASPVLIPISDPADPRLAPYAGLRDAHLREQGLAVSDPAGATFIAEGQLVVRQLVRSRLPVVSLLTTPTRLETIRDMVAGLPPAVPVYLASQAVMNTVAGFNIHRGLLAVGERPPTPDLDRLLAAARTLVTLEDLSNHDNIGGIFRAAAALGGQASAVLLSPRCADPLYRKSIRVSMGTALCIPFATLAPWPETLLRVRRAGFTLIALTPAPDAIPIHEIPPPARPALLLGAEGPGLTPAAQAAADLRVRIPIDPGFDSLNVVVAAGIALHRLAVESSRA